MVDNLLIACHIKTKKILFVYLNIDSIFIIVQFEKVNMNFLFNLCVFNQFNV